MVGFRAPGDKGASVGDEDVTMHDIVGWIANERVAAIFPGEQCRLVHHGAAGGRDVAAGNKLGGWEAVGIGPFTPPARALHAPWLEGADAVHLAGRPVVRDIEGDL